jgi:hypothetical protein
MKKFRSLLTSVVISASVFSGVAGFGSVGQAQQNQPNPDHQNYNRGYNHGNNMNRNQGNYNQYQHRRNQGDQGRGLGITLSTPAYSDSQDVVLRGMAFGSDNVRVFLNGQFLGTTPVINHRYEKSVRLRMGDNRVRITIGRGQSRKTVMRIIRVK